MKKILLSIIGLVWAWHCFAQYDQIEKIFDPKEQDWGNKTLGQISFSTISAVQLADEYYFTAYSTDSKIDIWKTDLTHTEIFFDLNEFSTPTLRKAYGDWLIYTEGSDEETCKFIALHAITKQEIPLLTGNTCQGKSVQYYSFIGDYLVDLRHNEVLYQDLSRLPDIDTQTIQINYNGLSRIHHIGDSKILLKDKINEFGYAPYYLLDLKEGSFVHFHQLMDKDFYSVSPFIEYKGRYYFQLYTEAYVEKLLISIDTNFSSESIQNHGNFLGNLLFIEEEKLYLSEYDDNDAYLGIYDLSTLEKLDNIPAHNEWAYSIWKNATKIKNHQYLLYGDNEAYYHFDIEKNQLTSLTVPDSEASFITPVLLLDNGIFIGSRSNGPSESLYFFPYETLEPKKILENTTHRLYETRLLMALPNDKVLTVYFDTLYSSEYSVIDVKNDEVRMLKDINEMNYGYNSMVEISLLLPNHDLFLIVNSEAGEYAFLFNPFTKESALIKDDKGEPVKFSPYNIYIYLIYQNYGIKYSEYDHHGSYAVDDSTIYFLGQLSDQQELHLLALNFHSKQIVKSIPGVNNLDKIFKVGNEIYLFRSTNEEDNLKKREILQLQGDQLVSIYEAEKIDYCYDTEDIHQYFIHDDILYFTFHGKLLSLNSRNNHIETLVDHAIKNSNGCYSDGVVFSNFFVKDNEVYFTESRASMIYFYVFFYGFNGDIEQYFWKTDGSLAGTQMLANHNDEIIEGLSFTSYLFVDDGDIFRSSGHQQFSNNSHLYKWVNTQWEKMEIWVDDTLTTDLPLMTGNFYSLLYSQPGDYQRIAARWGGRNYYTNYIPDDDARSQSSVIFSFQNGETPVIKTHKTFVSKITSVGDTNKYTFPFTTIGDKIYFPSQNLYGAQDTHHPEILQYSMQNDRMRNVIQHPTNYSSYDNHITKDEEYETGYIILGDEENGYFTKLFRLNACPLIDEPIQISKTTDSICNGQEYPISISGLGNMDWIFVKVDGEETPYKWRKAEGEDSYLLTLDMTEGDHTLDFFLDTGCGIDSIASHTVVETDGDIPEFSISVETVNEYVVRYTCSEGQLENYIWTVKGTDIITGLGTHSIEVFWGSVEEGSVELVVTKGPCSSELISIPYSKTTSVHDNILSPFLLMPNPSKGNLTIELPKHWNEAVYQLFSLDGKLLESKNLSSARTSLQLSKYSAGTYIISLENEYERTYQKLILQP